jgi:hypothetical protein
MLLRSWVASSLVRHYPSTCPQEPVPLVLEGALNEQFSFQVALRLETGRAQSVRLDVQAPSGWDVRVRRVGYVPLRHHNTPLEPAGDDDIEGGDCIPGFVPDPLFDQQDVYLPVGETHAFWVTVNPGRGCVPGQYDVETVVVPENGAALTHTVSITLHDVVLEKRRDFSVTHWFYCDALIDWYGTELFDEQFWDILPQYVRNVVDHGQDMLYVPVFTPPLDGVKRPSQLLRVVREGRDAYRFDWRDVKGYVDVARRCGIEKFEWCHFFTQWGVHHAIRVYEGQGRDERLLWPPDTVATSDTYRAFLAQFLPALHRFLSEEKLLDCSYFHVSDEPSGEEHLKNYREAREMLRGLAPWMRVMEALSEIEFAQQGLTDMPFPAIQTALDFVAAGIPSCCYYCCGPRGKYLNRLMDTPLPKIAMHGLLFYRWPFKGFLHWGYNYWYERKTRALIDPFTVQDALAWQSGWAYGDTFLVYPGPDGPLDSIRWEVFGESLQDYALLQTLAVDRESELLSAIRSFTDFPKTINWRADLRARLLGGARCDRAA